MCRGGSSIDEKVVDSSPRREAEVEHVLCEFTGHGCALVVILTLNYCLVLNRLYYTSPDLIGVLLLRDIHHCHLCTNGERSESEQ